jgi:hypothetical protein
MAEGPTLSEIQATPEYKTPIEELRKLRGVGGWLRWYIWMSWFSSVVFIADGLKQNNHWLELYYLLFAVWAGLRAYWLQQEDRRGVYLARLSILSWMWIIYFFVSRRVKVTYFPEKYPLD